MNVLTVSTGSNNTRSSTFNAETEKCSLEPLVFATIFTFARVPVQLNVCHPVVEVGVKSVEVPDEFVNVSFPLVLDSVAT